ncbi:unnamed protein product [Rhizophagus irregularis]|nr:unnamed protein product [Rhizophagus irregularis]
MPQTPCRRAQAVAKITVQLCNWNIQTHQGGGVTTWDQSIELVLQHRRVDSILLLIIKQRLGHQMLLYTPKYGPPAD